MARWDEILTLPVQNPPTPEFSAADIMWSRVEGWRETMDRLALIPFTRVGDFVRGEGNNKDCPTRFHVEARRRRPPEMAYKPKVDGILEYILYWCSFGPDDHRKGGTVRPSRTYSAKRKTPAGRPNTKRGCVCHFIVKRLIAEPSVALIIYNQDKHVDKKGLPCHGPQDQKAVGTRAMFAPDISDEFRLQIISLLYVGVPVETIMQRHTEMVEKQGGPCNRDDLLTHRYVRRLERKIRRSTYELDDDDYVSLGLWIGIHQDHIFYFEEYSDSEPFVLGIQTEWQLQQMIRFGNRRLLAADSRFGANKLKCPIYSLLVFDSNNNAIPVAWIVTPNFASGEIYRWLGSLYERVRSKDPTWILGGFIVDDPLADVHSIREVFKCSVLISFWKVRRSWHKNLIMKCSETEMRAQMSKRLGEAFSSICRGSGDVGLFEDFMEDFVDCEDFLDYFRGVWFPRIGQWVASLKALPLASTEVSAAFESYHHQLNLRLLNENDSTIYHRVDWLVDKLGTKVHSYYWLDEYSEKESFARYWRDEWKSGLTSWREALQIPDLDVVLDGKSAKVVSHKDREKVHIVMNPGSEFSLCDCGWSMMGNLCKHVIKSTSICRERGLVTPSTSLFDYNRTLMSTLCRPPYDSVIRDHAISLTVSVQTILNSLFDLQNGNADTTASVYAEQQTVVDLDNTDKDPMYENHLASEKGDENLRNENCSVSFDHSVEDATPRPVKEPSTLLSPIEQELASNNTIVNDTAEAETGNSLKEIRNLGSNSSNASKNRDGSWDDMVVDSCADQVNDTLDVSATEKINDIDPPSLHPLPSTSSSRSEADVVEEGSHDTQISDVLTNNDKEVRENLEAHPDGSMIIEVGVSNGVCHDAEEGSFLNQDSHLEIVEKSDLLQNSETVEKLGGEVVGATDRNEALDAKLIVSKMDLKPCSLVTKARLLGSLDGEPIDVVMNQDSEESTGNVRMSSDVGDRTESSDTMDIDMPAAVGEVDENVSLC